LAKKNAPICIGASLPSKLLSLEFTQTIRARKLEWLRTDSGTSYRLSKSKAPLSSRKAQLQPKEYLRGHKDCQPAIYDFHSHPQRDRHVFAAWYDAPKGLWIGDWWLAEAARTRL
jgi:hypothetical protein